jgi:DedD protein
MEVRVRERLIGALVLVAIVVLFVPAILKGRDPAPAALPESAPTRRVEVPIGNSTPAPEEQILVPEPTQPDSAPATPAPPPPDSKPEAGAPASARSAKPPAPPPEERRADSEPPARTPASPTPAAGAPASAWAVQLGAFSSRSKAEQLVSELRKRRYAAFVLEYRASGQVLYRVRVGPEQDRNRAEEIAARLAKDGFQTVVARHP